MKKLFTALICALIVLGIGGCSSKTNSNKISDPNEVYDSLIDKGYKFNYENGVLNIVGDLKIIFDEEHMSIYTSNTDDNAGFNVGLMDDKLGAVSVYGECAINIDTEKPLSDCDEVDKTSALKSGSEIIDSIEKLNTNYESLYNMCKWYENEKD